MQLSSWGWAQSCSKQVEDSNKHITEEIVRQVGHLPEWRIAPSVYALHFHAFRLILSDYNYVSFRWVYYLKTLKTARLHTVADRRNTVYEVLIELYCQGKQKYLEENLSQSHFVYH